VVSWWKHVVFRFTKIMAVWFGGNWFRHRLHGVGSGAAWDWFRCSMIDCFRIA